MNRRGFLLALAAVPAAVAAAALPVQEPLINGRIGSFQGFTYFDVDSGKTSYWKPCPRAMTWDIYPCDPEAWYES